MDNLTPDQLAMLRQYAQQNQGGNGMLTEAMRNYTDPNGGTWHPQYTGGWQGGEAGFDSTPGLTGFAQDAVAGKNKVGDTQHIYDANGRYSASGAIPVDDSMQSFLTALTLAAAPIAAGYAMGGAAAGGGEAAMGNGAFLGEAAWTPTAGGALDFGAAGGAAGVGGAAGGSGAVGTMQSLPLLEAAPTGVEGLSTIGTTGAAGGSGMLSGLGGKALGIGASLLGAAAGAQGQKSEQSTNKDIPEWLKPYAQKVLGMGSNVLDQQMTPEAQQGWKDMTTRGQGLLNRPMAGNGFDQRNQFGSNLLGQMYPQFNRGLL